MANKLKLIETVARHWFPVCFLGIAATVAFFDAIAPINSFDFWWHLKTGDYILESLKIPDVDPFTFTALADDPDSPGRPSFILKQYWLAQVLFSLVNDWFGLGGIIVLRGIIYAAITLLAGAFLYARGAWRPTAITLPLLILASRVALEDSDRPQNFTYLISFAVFVLIETAILSGKRWLLFLNVPLLLILSNLHGGFIVPLCYIVVYMCCSLFEERLKPLRKEFFFSGGLACLVTYFNPNRWEVVTEMLTLHKSTVVKAALEFQSPIKIFPYVMSNLGWLSFWGLLVLLVPSAMYFLWKKKYSLAFVSISVLIASLISMRFIFFMAPISVIVSSIFFDTLFFTKVRKLKIFVFCLFIGMCSIVLLSPWHSNRFKINDQIYQQYFPLESAKFMSLNSLPGRVFNFMDWGGFLEYKLWPRYQFFYDTRMLVGQTIYINNKIMHNEGSSTLTLDKYEISTVIVPSINIYTGEIFPLVKSLYESDGWSLAHYDDVALVFVRRGLLTKEISKDMVYYHVIKTAKYWQPYFPSVIGYHQSISEAYTRLGGTR